MNIEDLRGKTVVVTGAGSGVGQTLAVMLAEIGSNVAMVDIRMASLQQTLSLMKKADSHLLVPTDISREEEVKHFFETVSSRYGGLDVLVNCAGIWDEGGIEDIVGSRLDRMLDINLKGSFYMCREAFGLMRERSVGGAIVNIASTAGEYGSIRPAAHYAAAKGGIIAMSKSLAREGAKDRIRVNVVSPGPLDTPMTNLESEEQRHLVGERTLLGRVGLPEDICQGVLFLASSISSWITGEVLRVNGGSLI